MLVGSRARMTEERERSGLRNWSVVDADAVERCGDSRGRQTLRYWDHVARLKLHPSTSASWRLHSVPKCHRVNDETRLFKLIGSTCDATINKRHGVMNAHVLITLITLASLGFFSFFFVVFSRRGIQKSDRTRSKRGGNAERRARDRDGASARVTRPVGASECQQIFFSCVRR